METGKSKGQNLESKPGQTEMVSEATAGAKGVHTGPWQTDFRTAWLLQLSCFPFLLAEPWSLLPLKSLMVFLSLLARKPPLQSFPLPQLLAPASWNL